MADSPDPPRTYHKGNVAEDLRATATRMLATDRLENITIRRLTREVGVAPANFYNHYESLDDLLFGIAASSLNQAVERATAVWSRPGTKADLLVASATEFIQFCLRNRQLMRLMLGHRGHDRSDESNHASSRSFTKIAEFIYGDSVEPAFPDLDHELYGVAVGYIALTYGFALILTEGRFALDSENEAEISRFVRSGILPFLDGSAAATLSSGDEGGGPR